MYSQSWLFKLRNEISCDWLSILLVEISNENVMRPVRLDLGSHDNWLSIDFKMDWFGNWTIVHHIERCGGGSHRCKSLGLRKSLETWKEMRKRWVAVGYGAVASCCRLSLLLLLSGSAPRTSGSSRPSKKAGSFHQRRPRRQHISSSCWN